MAAGAIVFGGPSGLGAASDTGIAIATGMRDFRGADMNGDGLGDIAWSEVPDPFGNTLKVKVRLARTTGGFAEAVTLYSQWDALAYPQAEGGHFIGVPGRRVDLDGDGSEELLMNENWTIARISDRRYATDRPDVTFVDGAVLDFNDDGCTDIAYKHMSSGTLRVRPSACSIGAPEADLLGPAWTGNYEVQALDWNSDGRDDLLLRGTTNWLVAISQGDSVGPLEDTGIPHESAPAVAGRDLDGDGLEDIALKSSSQIRVRFRNGSMPDLLASVADGFGVGAEFTYRPLTDAAVHTPGSTASWPDPHLQTNDLVVSRLRATDGSGEGGQVVTTFRYEGFRGNTQGRGSLGFRKVIRTETADGESLSSVLTRRQDFPFTGLPESVVIQATTGAVIDSTEYRWSKLEFGTQTNPRRFPYPSSVTRRHFGSGGAYDGAEISRTVRSIAAIDPTSGLVTDETTTTTETAGGAHAGSSASVRTLHSGVLNDVANWCIGRSQAMEITASHTLAGGAPVTRSVETSWSGPKCRPTRTRLFPGDSQWQVTHDLAYDAFGNLASEKVIGAGMTARTVTTQWDARGQLPTRVTNPLAQASRYAWDEARGLPAVFHRSERAVGAMDLRLFRTPAARDMAGRHEHGVDARGLQGRLRRARPVPDTTGRGRQCRGRASDLLAGGRPARSRVPSRGAAAGRRTGGCEHRLRRAGPDHSPPPAALGRRPASGTSIVRLRCARSRDCRAPGRSGRLDRAVARTPARRSHDHRRWMRSGAHAAGRATPGVLWPRSSMRSAAARAMSTTLSAACCACAMHWAARLPPSPTTHAA